MIGDPSGVSTIRTWKIDINSKGVCRRHPSGKMIIAMGINKYFNPAGVICY